MKRINIKDKNAINKIAQYKNEKYKNTDIELQNTNLKKINKKLIYPIFKKNNLYVNSGTLFELMQPIGKKLHHNHHGLSENEILRTLICLQDSSMVFESYGSRYIIMSGVLKNGYDIVSIIELNAPLIDNPKASINKLITMYIKDSIPSKYKKISK